MMRPSIVPLTETMMEEMTASIDTQMTRLSGLTRMVMMLETIKMFGPIKARYGQMLT